MRKRAAGDGLLSADDFASIVTAYQRRLHAYLAGLISQHEAAFDLTQETFYDAWNTARKGRPPMVPGAADDDVRHWLYRVATNNGLTYLRHHRLIHWEPLEDHAVFRADGRTPFEEQLAENDLLQSALSCLVPEDAACILLRVVHGFSAREVGQILGMSPENVNTRLARAKQRLRVAYEQRSLSH